MKILSAFTRPQVVANSLKDNWKFGTIDFHSIVFLLWKSMVPKFQS